MGENNIIDSIILDDKFVRRTIITIVLFFIIPLFISAFLWGHLENTTLGKYVKESSKNVSETASQYTGLKYLLLPLIILIKNSIVSLLNIALSPLLVAPPLILATNGMIVGFVVNNAITSLSMKLQTTTGVGLITASALAPHGSIEIPAIGISASTIFYFIDYIRGERRNILDVFKRNAIISLTMLVFSALIESFITPIAVIIAMIIGMM